MIMGTLDNMQDKQKMEKDSDTKSALRVISNVYIWIGNVALILGIIYFIIGVSDPKHNANAIIGGIGVFFGGLFTIFAARTGEAIDDIRNNTKK